MGGREEEKGFGERALTSPAKILRSDSPFKISGLRFRVKLQRAPLQANVGDSLLLPGCGKSGWGGWDYRDDPAIHPSSKQSPVFPPQTLLIPF